LITEFTVPHFACNPNSGVVGLLWMIQNRLRLNRYQDTNLLEIPSQLNTLLWRCYFKRYYATRDFTLDVKTRREPDI